MRRPDSRFPIPALLLLALPFALPAQAVPSAERRAPRPAVVVLGFDGFARKYLDADSAPAFHALMRDGVTAEAMIPSFPTFTFPNWYTLATGLYPAHTGIVGNSFWDSTYNAMFVYTQPIAHETRWWGGEPIWVTASKSGVKSASFFWVGSEAVIGGAQPTILIPFDTRIQFESRVVQILSWLTLPDSMRPQLIMAYFEEPDHTGHSFGPDAPQTKAMVLRVDSMLAMFVKGLRDRGLYDKVDLVILADHGMAATSRDRVVFLDDVVDSASVRVVAMSPLLMIGARDGANAALVAKLRTLPHVKAWLRDSVPARWHYNNPNRITPVVAVADEGWTIAWRHGKPSTLGGGHGYDNNEPDMRAIFIARGPSFLSGVTMPPFENVNVYSLLAYLLGVKPAANDGSIAPFTAVLRQP
jgi:predicted AlkP superfamily pyrophosphatase or phosphodiesterase